MIKFGFVFFSTEVVVHNFKGGCMQEGVFLLFFSQMRKRFVYHCIKKKSLSKAYNAHLSSVEGGQPNTAKRTDS